MRRVVKRLCLVVLISLLACATVLGQGGTAQISGIVSDRTGAVLPGVDITATQTETSATRTTVTNETGSFVLPNLPVGPYRLEVALPGFRTFVQTGIVLQVNGSAVINAALDVGQLTETVEVQANAAMVETRSTGVGQVIDNTQILELPLIGRQVQDLVVLAGAAVVTSTPGASGRTFPGVARFSIAGGLDRGTSFTLDGANHNDMLMNVGQPLPFPDALQEFKVETSAVPAQYGFRSGGAVTAVTKSGTNEFHGSLFEFVRNGKFNARNFFATKGDTLKRNQFGGTIGGPIRENKMFFFFGYQGTTTRQAPSDGSSFVPTPAMIAGDFTKFSSTACRPTAINLPAPFVNNVAPASALSPAAINLAKRLPVAQDDCGTVRWGLPSRQNEQQFIGKLDYQLNNSHSMFWRYMGYPYEDVLPFSIGEAKDNLLTTEPPGVNNMFQALTFGDTTTVGATFVNSLRLAWVRERVDRTQALFVGGADIGIRNFWQSVPRLQVSVSQAFMIGNQTGALAKYHETSYQIADDIGILHGNHQFGVGANYLWGQDNNSGIPFVLGAFSFTGNATGTPLADFMLGRVTQLAQGGSNYIFSRPKAFAVYGQDSWKVKPNLTLSLGLRLEPNIPAGLYDTMNYFDVNAFLRNEKSVTYVNAPAGLFYPGDPQFPGNPDPKKPSNVVQGHFWQLAPRLGFIWDPLKDGKTVLRGAWGLFREAQVAEVFRATGQGPPWGGRITISDVPFDDPYRNFPGGNPFPFVPNKNAPFQQGGAISTAFPDTQQPVVQQWNFGIQREVVNNLQISASYIGSYVDHLYGAVELNPGVYIPGVANASGLCNTTVMGQSVSLRATAGATCSTTGNIQARRVLSLLDADGTKGATKYGFVNAWDSGGTRSYHGMLVSMTKRLSANFAATANYTLGHCIGHPSNVLLNPGASGLVTDINNRDYDRGDCNTSGTDNRHLANGNVAYNMPRFANAWVQRLAGSWRLSGILRARSGNPLRVSLSTDRTLTGVNSGAQRADVVSTDVYGNQCKTDLLASNPTCRWLNANAFATPAMGVLGNGAGSTVHGPASWTVDAGLSRTFTIAENHQLEFRAEASNFLNHTNLGNPTVALGSTFGRISTAGDPRIMQFALKYGF